MAVLIKSLMGACVHPTFISEWLGSGDWWTTRLAVIIGIPTYINGFAAVPLVANLIDMGMIPGAKIAFLIGGGVTNVPGTLAVFTPAQKPLLMWCIFLSLLGALISGVLYQVSIGLF